MLSVKIKYSGLGSAVSIATDFGIATDYGLDGPGSNSGWDKIFRPSRLAPGPTKPPVQWVPGLSWGRGVWGVGLIPPPPSRMPRS